MIDSIARTADIAAGCSHRLTWFAYKSACGSRGAKITEDDFARLASMVREASEFLVAAGQMAAPPTYFEQVAAIGLCYFRDCGADLAVLEVGLAGGSTRRTRWIESSRWLLRSTSIIRTYSAPQLKRSPLRKPRSLYPDAAVIGRQHTPSPVTC